MGVPVELPTPRTALSSRATSRGSVGSMESTRSGRWLGGGQTTSGFVGERPGGPVADSSSSSTASCQPIPQKESRFFGRVPRDAAMPCVFVFGPQNVSLGHTQLVRC